MMSGECKVLLDTSVLLLVYDGVDPIESIDDALSTKCDYYVPDIVIDELIKLASKNIGIKSRAARLALQYMRGKVKVMITDKRYRTADEFIKKYVMSDPSIIVATTDDELKRELKSKGIRVITWWFSKRKFVEV